MTTTANEIDRSDLRSWKNNSGETAPAFAAVGIYDSLRTADKNILQGSKPMAGLDIGINFPADCPSGSNSKLTKTVGFVLYDPVDGTPAVGQEWGIITGSWKIRRSAKGIKILGQADGTKVRAQILPGVTSSADLPVIYIVNIKGLPLQNRNIVGIGTPLFQPSGPNPTADYLPNQPTFYSAEVKANAPFAILLGNVANGDIVQAMTVGTWAIQVNVTDITHKWAITQDSNNIWMVSSNYGPCRILWKERQGAAGNAALGLQWAYIQTPWVEPHEEDIRAISFGTTPAAVMHQPTNPNQPTYITPGVGFAFRYISPGDGWPIGASWLYDTTGPPTIKFENHMAGEIASSKPLLLEYSRLSDTGEKIYIDVSEGCKEMKPSPPQTP